MNFDAAIKIVLQHEGGFADNPADHGGRTNYGITQRTYNAWLAKNNKPAADVKDMSEGTARVIYKEEFWPPFSRIVDEGLATALFDLGVLRGPGRVITLVQTLLGLTADGTMTPETLAGLNAPNPQALTFRFLRANVHAFVMFAVRDPSQLQFLDGWTQRVLDLLDFALFDHTET